MDKLDDLLVSQITLACLTNMNDNSSSSSSFETAVPSTSIQSNGQQHIDMKQQVEKYKYGLELAKFDVSGRRNDFKHF